MSFTNYRVFRITDEHIQLELQLNSQNEHDFKCTVSFEKELQVTGYPPLLVKPTCVCENIDNTVTTNIGITHELLEDDNFVVEDPFERNFNDEVKEDSVAQTNDESVQEVVGEVVNEVVGEVVGDVVNEVVNEVVGEVVSEEEKVVIPEAFDVASEVSNVSEVGEDDVVVAFEVIHEKPMDRDVNEILQNFDKHMELIMQRLESIEKLEANRRRHHAPEVDIVEDSNLWEEHKTETGYTYWWNRETDESVWTNPNALPHPPTATFEKTGETVIEVIKPMASRAPTPPPRTPTPESLLSPSVSPVSSSPPPNVAEVKQHVMKPHPPPPLTKPVSPLIATIKQIQSLYFNVPGAENQLIQIVLNHMRAIEHFDISGEEKKNIVINSIETIFEKNNATDLELILNLSSQLIDTLIAFDKQTQKIEEKRPTALSCFACQ
jgi:hypothetical protein